MSSNGSTPINSPRKIFGRTATSDKNAMLEYEMNKNLGQFRRAGPFFLLNYFSFPFKVKPSVIVGLCCSLISLVLPFLAQVQFNSGNFRFYCKQVSRTSWLWLSFLCSRFTNFWFCPGGADSHFREKAEKELGETGSELTYTKIRQLRQQLNIYAEHHQRGLGGRRDDSFLLRFLRAKKFDVDKAFKMVGLSWTFFKFLDLNR